MDKIIKVSTIVQANFYLSKNEIIVFKLDDGMGYIRKVEDKIKIIIQPTIGCSSIMIGDFNKLEKLIKEYDLELYVSKGGILISKKSSILDKIKDFLNKR